jgi:3D (Asp-Asp-Asp) domain-containing protein
MKVPQGQRYQKMPDGTTVDMNGWYTAVDTGNLIKGHGGEYIGGSRTAGVDIYFGSPSYMTLCDGFGRQTIYVSKKK